MKQLFQLSFLLVGLLNSRAWLWAQTGGGTDLTGSPAEPLGPSSRRTGLVLTEIMFKPAPRPDSNTLEYIEVYNSNPFFEDISGYRITGDIDFTFPSNTVLAGEAFLVLAKAPADVKRIYGITNVIGPYTHSLPSSGAIRLRNDRGAVYLEVPYSDKPPWPAGADGTGHSLVLARPSYGERQARAWALSDAVGGSPGRPETSQPSPLRHVVINEFLAHTDDALLDFIELYNHSTQSVDISGCVLSDDPQMNKFFAPPDTILPPRGFVVFDQHQLGFALKAAGETIYFKSAEGTRVLDAVHFEAQGQGISSGRYPDGAAAFYPLVQRTPGGMNGGVWVSEIVINEIMYAPLSGRSDDEYIELYNRGTNNVSLADWRLSDGVSFVFPSNVVVAPKDYLVIAKSITNLLARYPHLNRSNTLGDFAGALNNGGERVALARPYVVTQTNHAGAVERETLLVTVDEVTYGTGGQWGHWAHGGGSSLELIDARSNHRLAANWADSDETAKAPWTTIEATGAMDNGVGPADRLEVLALGEGEYLLDNVSVRAGTNGPNLLSPANATFESGFGDWTARGNHARSSLQAGAGFGGGQCLHIRASDRGDTLANRVLLPLTSTLNGTVTLRAQVRWLRGWPEILLRLNGNHFEATGPLGAPISPGTPGQPNSRAVTNAGPAIYAVSHHPVVPAANEPVVVTARAQDADGVALLSLLYRIDPSTNYITVAMADGGAGNDAVAGDGLYSATIPSQPAGTLVAFLLRAFDRSSIVTLFPAPALPNTLASECLVRFGDPVPASRFGTYRLWLSRHAVRAWTNQPVLSNEKIGGTFVYGTCRAIYNVGGKYAGSPYHQAFTSPLADAHYSLEMPRDDLVLGTDSFNKLHAPGNAPFDDPTLQREQTMYWMARQLGLPWLYRRYVNVFVNGNRRGPLMEDAQVPDGEVIEEFFPDDPEGQLFKLQAWFEQEDIAVGPSLPINNESWCTLNKYTNAGGIHKLARYRWNYQGRALAGTANDYTNVFALIDAANTTAPTPFVANLQTTVDIEQWLRTFALQHASGNWDSFGYDNGQNMYAYKPERGPWRLLIWDWNVVLGNASSHGPDSDHLFSFNTQSLPGQPGGDPVLGHIYSTPAFRRVYLRAFQQIADGPMLNAKADPVMDAKYAAFLADGLNVSSPDEDGMKDYIASMRASLLTTLASEGVANVAFTVDGPDTFSTANNVVLLSGTAPLEAATVRINGIAYPLSWTGLTTWRLQVPLHSGSNRMLLQSYAVNGQPLGEANRTFTITVTAAEVPPSSAIVINEIMYHPVVPEASYVELFNAATNFVFDLSGWRMRGLDYTFPPGTLLTNGQFLVLAKDRAVFKAVYGSTAFVFDEFAGALGPGTETLILEAPVTTLHTNTESLVLTNLAYTVVDKVRYEDRLPWPNNAQGLGSALQLIDAAQDHGRVSNWGDGTGWRFYTFTGLPGANATNLNLFLSAAGDIFIDDVSLVAGPVAEQGMNLVQNGDFESPFLETWRALGSHSNSAISSDAAFGGNNSLHIATSGPGSGSSSISQPLSVLAAESTYTFSFWFLPSTTATGLTWRVTTAYRAASPLNVRQALATPGASNATAALLPPYPLLWINEVLPENLSGMADSAGQRDPWIELYNSGPEVIGLDGLYLANNYTNLTQWAFPLGTLIGPGEFQIIFADAEPDQSQPGELHTNFRLTGGSGTVALSRVHASKPQVIDYLTYEGVPANSSYGSFPDGQLFERQSFDNMTPGSANNGAPPPLRLSINEWMASNTGALADPADGHFDDWFELYNPNPQPVNLAGYFLTDDLTDPARYPIPTGYTIAARSFLLVWADSQPGQNSADRRDLHVNFKLNKDSAAIGLFAPDSRPINTVVLGAQTRDVSQGRHPDGAGTIYFLGSPTARSPNAPPLTNTPPVLSHVADLVVDELKLLSFQVEATDADLPRQHLSFGLAPGGPAGATITPAGLFRWVPSEAQGPGEYDITLRVTDSGVPNWGDEKTFHVTVNEVNSAPFIVDRLTKYVKAGNLLAFPTAVDLDVPTQELFYFLDAESTPGARLDGTTGVFSWRPSEFQPPGTYYVYLLATDEGVPSLSADYLYTINLLASSEVLIQVEIDRASDDRCRLRWSATIGQTYRVEYQDTLEPGEWRVLWPNLTAETTEMIVTDDLSSSSQRFYRVSQLD